MLFAAPLALTVLTLGQAEPAPAADATATAEAAAPAAEAADTVAEPAKDKPFPLGGNVSLTQSVGSGTFSSSPWNPTVSTTLTLSPSARLTDDWNLSLRQIVGLEWTDSDSTTYPRQLELSDLTVSTAYTGVKLPALNLGFVFGGGLDLPISLYSRQIGRLAALKASATTSWSHEATGLSASLNVGGGASLLVPSLGQNVNDPVKSYTDRLGNSILPVACNLRSSAELDSYGCLDGGIPSVAGWSATLQGGWTTLEGQLSLGASFGYRQGFSAYVGPDDEFTADNAVPGLVPRQGLSADLSASYTPVSWFVLTGGVSSNPSFFAPDTKGLRVPYVDFFTSAYNNFSSLYVDTSFSF